MVLLHYQSESDRLKVVIHKANKLPKTELSPFKPGDHLPPISQRDNPQVAEFQ